MDIFSILLKDIFIVGVVGYFIVQSTRSILPFGNYKHIFVYKPHIMVIQRQHFKNSTNLIRQTFVKTTHKSSTLIILT